MKRHSRRALAALPIAIAIAAPRVAPGHRKIRLGIGHLRHSACRPNYPARVSKSPIERLAPPSPVYPMARRALVREHVVVVEAQKLGFDTASVANISFVRKKTATRKVFDLVVAELNNMKLPIFGHAVRSCFITHGSVPFSYNAPRFYLHTVIRFAARTVLAAATQCATAQCNEPLCGNPIA